MLVVMVTHEPAAAVHCQEIFVLHDGARNVQHPDGGASMRPAWRLAINSLSARRNRTLLLMAAVALSAALIAAVSCAMASVSSAVHVRMDQTVGKSDLRIKPAGTGARCPRRCWSRRGDGKRQRWRWGGWSLRRRGGLCARIGRRMRMGRGFIGT